GSPKRMKKSLKMMKKTTLILSTARSTHRSLLPETPCISRRISRKTRQYGKRILSPCNKTAYENSTPHQLTPRSIYKTKAVPKRKVKLHLLSIHRPRSTYRNNKRQTLLPKNLHSA